MQESCVTRAGDEIRLLKLHFVQKKDKMEINIKLGVGSGTAFLYIVKSVGSGSPKETNILGVWIGTF